MGPFLYVLTTTLSNIQYIKKYWDPIKTQIKTWVEIQISYILNNENYYIDSTGLYNVKITPIDFYFDDDECFEGKTTIGDFNDEEFERERNHLKLRNISSKKKY